ncbi:glucose 1-dehydrogenase [Desulfogranum marinum]|uniref:SDR family NAD(P)-dependent oxidoreductase n=1 Tax=Desulfogranum marinum TaxID=453220 RepID=UPI0029C8A50E|nr:glucose 1-dehydrogenase [Desulfogranum marinum]
MNGDQAPPIIAPKFDLSGKKALITGASRGIGRALAIGLAQAGAEVVLAGRNTQLLSAVAAEISAEHARPTVLCLDVTDVEALPDAVETCCSKIGGLDTLVNNAGFERVQDSLQVTPSTWDTIVDTNLKGAFFMAQAAAKVMLESGSGSIVNVCSLASSVGIPTAVPYTSSKSGLLGMTRALSSEWAPKGIRVNGIAPGYFRTAMTDVFFQDNEWAEAMLAKIPAGRFGRVEDLIGAVVFFASPAAEYITGQMLTIDGGYLASI